MNQKKRFSFTPFPDGIFAIAFSHEVCPKQVISIIFMGEKIALFRTEKGELGALEGYCPHLGADLTGGKVKKDFLQCPFHGLQFKKDGCFQTKNRHGIVGRYYAKSWPVFEKYGLIFLTHYPLGNDLNIYFPEWNRNEWGTPIEHCFKIRSHPQEILENSVDKLHFFQVHKYLSVKNVKPFQTKNSEFFIHYHLERREGIFGFLDRTKTELHLDIHAYGLGLSKVDVVLPKYNLEVKQMVFPTPIDEEFIHLRTLTSVKIPEKLPWIPRWMTPRFVKKQVANILSYIASKGFLKDFLPDLHIWENKKYISRVNCLSDDGDFEQYREWAVQFYREKVELPSSVPD